MNVIIDTEMHLQMVKVILWNVYFTTIKSEVEEERERVKI